MLAKSKDNPPNQVFARPIVTRTIELCLIFYFLFILYHFQFVTPYFVGVDGYYHSRMGNLLWQKGIMRHFPWTQFSLWYHKFADKEMLYHFYVSLFTWKEAWMMTGGKWAAYILAAAIALVFLVILKKLQVPAPALWIFLLLSCSPRFLGRLAMLRPHNLSILLIIIGYYLLLTRHYSLFAVVNFIYAWSYSAVHLLFSLTLLYVIVIAVLEQRWLWKPLVVSAAGLLAGLLINPYFPNNFYIWYVQIVEVLLRAWGIKESLVPGLGVEFFSITIRSVVQFNTLMVLMLFLSLYLAAISRKKVTAETASLLLIMIVSFFLYSFSSRFIEYLAPFTVWACAMVFRDIIKNQTVKTPTITFTPRNMLLWLIIIGAVFFLHVRNNKFTFGTLKNTPEPTLQQAALWMRANIPPRQVIFHPDWSMFCQLFHYDPDHYYIAGLDPTFSYYFDPAKTELLEKLRQGLISYDPQFIKNEFGTSYVIIEKLRKDIARGETRFTPTMFYQKAQELGEERIIYQDKFAVIYRL